MSRFCVVFTMLNKAFQLKFMIKIDNLSTFVVLCLIRFFIFQKIFAHILYIQHTYRSWYIYDKKKLFVINLYLFNIKSHSDKTFLVFWIRKYGTAKSLTYWTNWIFDEFCCVSYTVYVLYDYYYQMKKFFLLCFQFLHSPYREV